MGAAATVMNCANVVPDTSFRTSLAKLAPDEDGGLADIAAVWAAPEGFVIG